MTIAQDINHNANQSVSFESEVSSILKALKYPPVVVRVAATSGASTRDELLKALREEVLRLKWKLGMKSLPYDDWKQKAIERSQATKELLERREQELKLQAQCTQARSKKKKKLPATTPPPLDPSKLARDTAPTTTETTAASSSVDGRPLALTETAPADVDEPASVAVPSRRRRLRSATCPVAPTTNETSDAAVVADDESSERQRWPRGRRSHRSRSVVVWRLGETE